jgi:protease I
MTGDVQTAAQLVRALHEFEATPQIPRLNIHLMATAPGNEHLLALMTEPVADPGRLAGMRVAILATHGSEEAEVIIPRSWLRSVGARVDIVAPRDPTYPARFGAQLPCVATDHILLVRFLENAGWLPVDCALDDVTVDDYDAIIIPGGAWNPDALRGNDTVLAFVRAFQATGKPVAAICHGPLVLVSARLLAGRHATGVWNVQIDLTNAGATVVDQPVVIDGNVITGRFVYDLPDFLEALSAQMVSTAGAGPRLTAEAAL